MCEKERDNTHTKKIISNFFLKKEGKKFASKLFSSTLDLKSVGIPSAVSLLLYGVLTLTIPSIHSHTHHTTSLHFCLEKILLSSEVNK